MASTDSPPAGDACILLKVTGPRFVALASWIIVRLRCQDVEILRLGSGTSRLDNRSAYWKDTNQVFGVWTHMARSLSAEVMTQLVG